MSKRKNRIRMVYLPRPKFIIIARRHESIYNERSRHYVNVREVAKSCKGSGIMQMDSSFIFFTTRQELAGKTNKPKVHLLYFLVLFWYLLKYFLTRYYTALSGDRNWYKMKLILLDGHTLKLIDTHNPNIATSCFVADLLKPSKIYLLKYWN